jgi:hypothetical protein
MISEKDKIIEHKLREIATLERDKRKIKNQINCIIPNERVDKSLNTTNNDEY